MTAVEIEARMTEIIHQLGRTYPEMVEAEREWKRAVAEAENKVHEEFLLHRAAGKSVSECEHQAEAAAYPLVTAAIERETQFKRLHAGVRVWEREYDGLRSFLGMERAKLEQHIEMADGGRRRVA